MRQILCCGRWTVGGVAFRSPERIYEEVAFLALHLGWSYERLMQMDHFERKRWVKETLSLLHGPKE
ncbi:MAG: hypothetical protein FWF85_04285 [Clostridiales bacterium]|nr:hypothetical protein [Clostridiales bacterium]